MREGRDLVGELVHRDIVILGTRHQEYVLREERGDAAGLVFLIVLQRRISRPLLCIASFITQSIGVIRQDVADWKQFFYTPESRVLPSSRNEQIFR